MLFFQAPPAAFAAEATPFYQPSTRPRLPAAECEPTDRLSCPKRSDDPDMHAKVTPSVLKSTPKAFDVLELPGSRLGPPLLTPLTLKSHSKNLSHKRRGTARKHLTEKLTEQTSLNTSNSASELTPSSITKDTETPPSKVSSRSIELWRLIHSLSAVSLSLDFQPQAKPPTRAGIPSTVTTMGPSSSAEVDGELAREYEAEARGPVDVGVEDALVLISTIQKRLESYSREEVDAWQVQSELTKLIIRMTRHRSPRLRTSLAHVALQVCLPLTNYCHKYCVLNNSVATAAFRASVNGQWTFIGEYQYPLTFINKTTSSGLNVRALDSDQKGREFELLCPLPT
ncbi:unnamed protein product [Dibothriocephalus latus]|uniref:Uncharacterized protein n=1 Tax=Dibothriocephalus latus TaxID=60516 RepID=A0A3P7L911_DIBLA|nr:unnamed protein product [Dibothriocephalus latus]